MIYILVAGFLVIGSAQANNSVKIYEIVVNKLTDMAYAVIKKVGAQRDFSRGLIHHYMHLHLRHVVSDYTTILHNHSKAGLTDDQIATEMIGDIATNAPPKILHELKTNLLLFLSRRLRINIFDLRALASYTRDGTKLLKYLSKLLALLAKK